MKRKLISGLVALAMTTSLTLPALADTLQDLTLTSNDVLEIVSPTNITLEDKIPGGTWSATVSAKIHKNGNDESHVLPATVHFKAGTQDFSIDFNEYDVPKSVTLTGIVQSNVGLQTINFSVTSTDSNPTADLNIQNGKDNLQVSFNVVNSAPEKIKPSVTWPTATITYGQQLTDSSFTSGYASYNGAEVAGTFSYDSLSESLLNASDIGYNYSTTFTPSDTTKYNPVQGFSHVTVNKAEATIDVKSYNVTYDGNSHTATGTATGVGGVDLSSGLNLSGTTHTNAGTYNDTWTFTDTTGNYNDNSGAVNDSIAKADAAFDIRPYNVTYDGASHTATGTVTGVKDETLSGLDLSQTTHTNAGAYTDSWTFTDITGNYKNAADTINDVIAKAASTTTINGIGDVKYGTPINGTASVTGAGGLSQSLQVSYAGVDFNGIHYGPSNSAPTKPGQYTASATFVGDVNHNGSSASINFTISYDFNGFFQPVDMNGIINTVKAGSAIPVKFSLHGNMGLNIISAGYPGVAAANFATNAISDDIETVLTAGNSSLSYDSLTDTYTYVWKTDKAWIGLSKQFTLKLIDGTTCTANFKFK